MKIVIEQVLEVMAYVEWINHVMLMIPTIVFPDGSIRVKPSNVELAKYRKVVDN